MSEIKTLSPKLIWQYFYAITQIPRPSKKEDKIIAYLIDFAKSQNLEYKLDEVRNVLIKKPATSGYEDKPTVILQSHIDMVCEKNSDTDFNFDTDPIETFIEDGWVKAKGTTLGGDDGIGVAAQLAVLADSSIEHGAIECLFTVDEETGLTGAFALERNFLDGSVLLNLDSEDWGELFIGCAGGVDTLAKKAVVMEQTPSNSFAVKVTVAGLLGGHSGGDIHKELGNANKILNRFLYQEAQKYDLRIASFSGGNLRNAIAREAYTEVVLPVAQKENIRVALNVFVADVEKELGKVEPKFEMRMESMDLPNSVLDRESQTSLLKVIYALPHGVVAWSKAIPNLVETSTNLASVKLTSDEVEIVTSQRSSLESAKQDIANQVKLVFELGGFTVKNTDGYPGWAPNPASNAVQTTIEQYKELFKSDPEVKAIHAGLECGLFLEKYPHLDMVSFGPTILGAHSPDERMEIDTVGKFWDLLLAVLKNI